MKDEVIDADDVTDEMIIEHDERLPAIGKPTDTELAQPGMMWVDESYVDQIEKAAALAPRVRDAIGRIILNVMPKNAWVTFDGKKARIGNNDAMSALNMMPGFRIIDMAKDVYRWKDENGPQYRITYRGVFEFADKHIICEDARDSYDKFFRKADGKLREIRDVNENHVAMAAYNGCVGGAIKMLLGIRSVSIDWINELGLDVKVANKSDVFKGKKSGGERAPTPPESPRPQSPPAGPGAPPPPPSSPSPTSTGSVITAQQKKQLYGKGFGRAEELGYSDDNDARKNACFRILNHMCAEAGVKKLEQLPAEFFQRACDYISTATLQEE